MASQISIPAAVLGLQGALNTALGIYGVVRPASLIAQVVDQFGGSIPRPLGYIFSLQLLNMGVLTFFAASRPSLHRRALIARISLHLVAGYLFWDESYNLRNVALREIGFAFLNAITIPFVRTDSAL